MDREPANKCLQAAFWSLGLLPDRKHMLASVFTATHLGLHSQLALFSLVHPNPNMTFCVVSCQEDFFTEIYHTLPPLFFLSSTGENKRGRTTEGGVLCHC